ncbi:hypothetical protein SARC_03950 [Sphaeroforma arctica JP610]|uniref:ARID domain-containing protein n=1 Tax=Sphaeroforma arctica JP610 TaxID=667725 RepID=A0A0L0G4U0_9EUKA|nr:hypothetical protein SARC_03950 [Sphaeroforma arctica JP610]KNC83821.1 hypothetical protein SARC_03950 [Sphaeroforma arctica JP610]|eukprot:XP_014157723.1 hypothetical protein SARC_03950 [Sphaeroforma arctica JP610]
MSTQVTRKKDWKYVSALFLLPRSCTNASFQLRQMYYKWLYAYEEAHFPGCVPVSKVDIPPSFYAHWKPRDASPESPTQSQKSLNPSEPTSRRESVTRSISIQPNEQGQMLNQYTQIPSRQNSQLAPAPPMTLPPKTRDEPIKLPQRTLLQQAPRVVFALQSQLPNEVDWALNTLLLITYEFRIDCIEAICLPSTLLQMLVALIRESLSDMFATKSNTAKSANTRTHRIVMPDSKNHKRLKLDEASTTCPINITKPTTRGGSEDGQSDLTIDTTRAGGSSTSSGANTNKYLSERVRQMLAAEVGDEDGIDYFHNLNSDGPIGEARRERSTTALTVLSNMSLVPMYANIMSTDTALLEMLLLVVSGEGTIDSSSSSSEGDVEGEAVRDIGEDTLGGNGRTGAQLATCLQVDTALDILSNISAFVVVPDLPPHIRASLMQTIQRNVTAPRDRKVVIECVNVLGRLCVPLDTRMWLQKENEGHIPTIGGAPVSPGPLLRGASSSPALDPPVTANNSRNSHQRRSSSCSDCEENAQNNSSYRTGLGLASELDLDSEFDDSDEEDAVQNSAEKHYCTEFYSTAFVPSLVSLLDRSDPHLMLAVSDCLYQLTHVSQRYANAVAQQPGVIGLLVALLTFNVKDEEALFDWDLHEDVIDMRGAAAPFPGHAGTLGARPLMGKALPAAMPTFFPQFSLDQKKNKKNEIKPAQARLRTAARVHGRLRASMKTHTQTNSHRNRKSSTAVAQVDGADDEHPHTANLTSGARLSQSHLYPTAKREVCLRRVTSCRHEAKSVGRCEHARACMHAQPHKVESAIEIGLKRGHLERRTPHHAGGKLEKSRGKVDPQLQFMSRFFGEDLAISQVDGVSDEVGTTSEALADLSYDDGTMVDAVGLDSPQADGNTQEANVTVADDVDRLHLGNRPVAEHVSENTSQGAVSELVVTDDMLKAGLESLQHDLVHISENLGISPLKTAALGKLSLPVIRGPKVDAHAPKSTEDDNLSKKFTKEATNVQSPIVSSLPTASIVSMAIPSTVNNLNGTEPMFDGPESSEVARAAIKGELQHLCTEADSPHTNPIDAQTNVDVIQSGVSENRLPITTDGSQTSVSTEPPVEDVTHTALMSNHTDVKNNSVASNWAGLEADLDTRTNGIHILAAMAGGSQSESSNSKVSANETSYNINPPDKGTSGTGTVDTAPPEATLISAYNQSVTVSDPANMPSAGEVATKPIMISQASADKPTVTSQFPIRAPIQQPRVLSNFTGSTPVATGTSVADDAIVDFALNSDPKRPGTAQNTNHSAQQLQQPQQVVQAAGSGVGSEPQNFNTNHSAQQLQRPQQVVQAASSGVGSEPQNVQQGIVSTCGDVRAPGAVIQVINQEHADQQASVNVVDEAQPPTAIPQPRMASNVATGNTSDYNSGAWLHEQAKGNSVHSTQVPGNLAQNTRLQPRPPPPTLKQQQTVFYQDHGKDMEHSRRHNIKPMYPQASVPNNSTPQQIYPHSNGTYVKQPQSQHGGREAVYSVHPVVDKSRTPYQPNPQVQTQAQQSYKPPVSPRQSSEYLHTHAHNAPQASSHVKAQAQGQQQQLSQQQQTLIDARILMPRDDVGDGRNESFPVHTQPQVGNAINEVVVNNTHVTGALQNNMESASQVRDFEPDGLPVLTTPEASETSDTNMSDTESEEDVVLTAEQLRRHTLMKHIVRSTAPPRASATDHRSSQSSSAQLQTRKKAPAPPLQSLSSMTRPPSTFPAPPPSQHPHSHPRASTHAHSQVHPRVRDPQQKQAFRPIAAQPRVRTSTVSPALYGRPQHVLPQSVQHQHQLLHGQRFASPFDVQVSGPDPVSTGVQLNAALILRNIAQHGVADDILSAYGERITELAASRKHYSEQLATCLFALTSRENTAI